MAEPTRIVNDVRECRARPVDRVERPVVVRAGESGATEQHEAAGVGLPGPGGGALAVRALPQEGRALEREDRDEVAVAPAVAVDRDARAARPVALDGHLVRLPLPEAGDLPGVRVDGGDDGVVQGAHRGPSSDLRARQHEVLALLPHPERALHRRQRDEGLGVELGEHGSAQRLGHHPGLVRRAVLHGPVQGRPEVTAESGCIGHGFRYPWGSRVLRGIRVPRPGFSAMVAALRPRCDPGPPRRPPS